MFGETAGTCANCPVGKYNDLRGSTECSHCPDDKIPNEKKTSCELPSYGSCKMGQYLNDSSVDAKDWNCELCPDGALCVQAGSSAPTFNMLKPQEGYRALSWNNHTFGRCPTPAACNDNNNESIGGCLVGHNPNSELCSQCLDGYASQGRGEICEKCPEDEETGGLFFGAIMLAVLVFAFLVYDNLDGASDMIPQENENETSDENVHSTTTMPFHSIVIRIVSSFLQTAGMLVQFNLDLPPSVHTLIIVKASTSSLSEQLLLFDCGTIIRNSRDLFILKQTASVWLIPLSSVLVCGVFWTLAHVLYLRGKKGTTGLDGFISSLMVLFYTLFPSVVNRVALIFSCKTYGRGSQAKSLFTEALSVKCFSNEHWSIIWTVGIPGILLYVVVIPTAIALSLIQQRRKKTLYPHQLYYESRWTLRFGFMFAGYKEGYEWWESIVMLRKCCFVLLAIFLRQYGPAPQVVAAALILIAALSAELQNLPYQNKEHDHIEAIGLQACLLQLLVALLCNLVGLETMEQQQKTASSTASLGPKSTVLLILVVFGSTVFFFTVMIRATIINSKETKGFVGSMSRLFGDRCGKQRQQQPKQQRENNVGGDSNRLEMAQQAVSNTVVVPILTQPRQQPQRMKRRTSSFSAQTITKAVTHHKVATLEQEQIKHRRMFQTRVKEREQRADARVRQRLIERRQLKSRSGGVKAIKSSSSSSSEGPILADDVRSQSRTKLQKLERDGVPSKELLVMVEKTRCKLKQIIRTVKKLRVVFTKLDVDANGMLSKKEFEKLVIAFFKQKSFDPKMLGLMWDAVWEQRKHGAEDELDSATLSHWLGLDG